DVHLDPWIDLARGLDHLLDVAARRRLGVDAGALLAGPRLHAGEQHPAQHQQAGDHDDDTLHISSLPRRPPPAAPFRQPGARATNPTFSATPSSQSVSTTPRAAPRDTRATIRKPITSRATVQMLNRSTLASSASATLPRPGGARAARFDM